MTDIYDEAIHATIIHDDIEDSWREGGEGADRDMRLDGLLFRSCPHMGCCLTETKQELIAVNEDESSEEAWLVFDDIRNDDLIPSDVDDLCKAWDSYNVEERLIMLEQFAMHNRQLDYVFDRDPQPLEQE